MFCYSYPITKNMRGNPAIICTTLLVSGCRLRIFRDSQESRIRNVSFLFCIIVMLLCTRLCFHSFNCASNPHALILIVSIIRLLAFTPYPFACECLICPPLITQLRKPIRHLCVHPAPCTPSIRVSPTAPGFISGALRPCPAISWSIRVCKFAERPLRWPRSHVFGCFLVCVFSFGLQCFRIELSYSVCIL